MSDRYRTFQELEKAKKYGVDYMIERSEPRSTVCIFSPHAGKIEWGVSELVRAVAENSFSLYLFEGNQKINNRELHITSHRFNEPGAVTFLAQHHVALALHGEDDNVEARTYLGGRNMKARELIGGLLRDADFEVPEQTPKGLGGEEPMNICNRCSSLQGGVQLEITAAQRAKFFLSDHPEKQKNREHKSKDFQRYVDALKAALSCIKNDVQSF